MAELLSPLKQIHALNKSRPYVFISNTPHLLQQKTELSIGNLAKASNFHQFYGGLKVANHVDISTGYNKANWYDEGEQEHFPHVQTLRKFPEKELVDKVVMVRFDSNILLREELDRSTPIASTAIFTIKYLSQAAAKVILVSDWRKKHGSKMLDVESVADILSSLIEYKVVAVECISCNMLLDMEVFNNAKIFLLQNLFEFKEEAANNSNFAKQLSLGVDIFVNDSFHHSHKVLASTVGVARFCTVSVAGFHFEESLWQLKNALNPDKRPYFAIVCHHYNATIYASFFSLLEGVTSMKKQLLCSL